MFTPLKLKSTVGLVLSFLLGRTLFDPFWSRLCMNTCLSALWLLLLFWATKTLFGLTILDPDWSTSFAASPVPIKPNAGPLLSSSLFIIDLLSVLAHFMLTSKQDVRLKVKQKPSSNFKKRLLNVFLVSDVSRNVLMKAVVAWHYELNTNSESLVKNSLLF